MARLRYLLSDRLERAQESYEILLFLRSQFEFVNQVEELNRVFQGEQPPVVKIGR